MKFAGFSKLSKDIWTVNEPGRIICGLGILMENADGCNRTSFRRAGRIAG